MRMTILRAQCVCHDEGCHHNGDSLDLSMQMLIVYADSKDGTRLWQACAAEAKCRKPLSWVLLKTSLCMHACCKAYSAAQWPLCHSLTRHSTELCQVVGQCQPLRKRQGIRSRNRMHSLVVSIEKLELKGFLDTMLTHPCWCTLGMDA